MQSVDSYAARLCESTNTSINKFCDLDPMPTVLLKACIDTLLGTITNIVNVSLRTGIFPDDFKQAHVNPLLKKIT